MSRKQKRKSPIKHRVKKHSRKNGATVRQHTRGSGQHRRISLSTGLVQPRQKVMRGLDERERRTMQGLIDVGIQTQVDRIQGLGIKTLASCEGHVGDAGELNAYVMMLPSDRVMKNLRKIVVEEDMVKVPKTFKTGSTDKFYDVNEGYMAVYEFQTLKILKGGEYPYTLTVRVEPRDTVTEKEWADLRVKGFNKILKTLRKAVR